MGRKNRFSSRQSFGGPPFLVSTKNVAHPFIPDTKITDPPPSCQRHFFKLLKNRYNTIYLAFYGISRSLHRNDESNMLYMAFQFWSYEAVISRHSLSHFHRRHWVHQPQVKLHHPHRQRHHCPLIQQDHHHHL